MTMNRLPVRLLLLPACVLFGAVGCETTQGPVAQTAPATAVGPAREIEPAPVSKSYPKKEAFQAAEFDSGIVAAFPNAKQIRLRTGEVLEVFRGNWNPAGDTPELAFFLPPEATAIAQVVVETKGFTKTYFLKGLAPGESVGGTVERRWLDGSGFRAKDTAMEARIQAAIKAQPFLILVQ